MAESTFVMIVSLLFIARMCLVSEHNENGPVSRWELNSELIIWFGLRAVILVKQNLLVNYEVI